MRNHLAELLPDNTRINTDIIIEPSLAGTAPTLLKRISFDNKKLLIVCDSKTYAVAGRRLAEELAGFKPDLLILEGKVEANEDYIALIQSRLYDALIAVGSGVISDLCKYASYTHGKPYAVFPTAPSMNGYLSANASMTLDSIKESRTAHLPMGVFCDLDIIAAAPIRLIHSGLGDSLCRPTAQADWLLSHLVLGTPYSSLPFDLLKPYEAMLFSQADRLATRDLKTIELLVKTLLVSGLGMTLSGGSYPASQCEHMIAHTMEMKHGEALPETFHGEQIGVTTLTMARIQHELVGQPLILPQCPNWQDALASYFGRKKAQYLSPGPELKYWLYDNPDIAEHLARNESEIRFKLQEIMLPVVYIHDVLISTGLPATAEELGWRKSDYNTAVAHAAFTRERFGFLDFLPYPRPL